MQGRTKKGTFTNKSSSDRQVKSIRATEEVWDKFGEQANELGITRADYLEQIALNKGVIRGEDTNRVLLRKIAEIIGILKHGVTSKKQGGTYASNNAKSLREKVLNAIAILEDF